MHARLFRNACLFFYLLFIVVTFAETAYAKSYYVKSYRLPSHAEFHGEIKTNDPDVYYLFLQKLQFISVEISDKRFNLTLTGPYGRENFMESKDNNGGYFQAPESGLYKLTIQSTHRNQQCICYMLSISFLD